MLLIVECKYKLLEDKKVQEINMEKTDSRRSEYRDAFTEATDDGLVHNDTLEVESLIPNDQEVTIKQVSNQLLLYIVRPW